MTRRAVARTAVLAVAWMLWAPGADAATVTVTTQDVGASDPNANVCSLSSGGPSSQCVSGPQANTAGGIGYASASADIVTGELKAKAQHIGDDAAEISGLVGTAVASFSETYTVSGTGMVTASLEVHGSWNLSTFAPSALNYQIQADINNGMGGSAELFLIPSNSSSSGSVDQVFSVDYAVRNGTPLTVGFSLLTQIINGVGTIEFSNTARALVEAGAGVTITPSDPLFLSQPTFGMNPVPLPGAAWMFLTALGGLGLFGWRGRRDAA